MHVQVILRELIKDEIWIFLGVGEGGIKILEKKTQVGMGGKYVKWEGLGCNNKTTLVMMHKGCIGINIE